MKLKRTQREVPVRQQPKATENNDAATDTTISADTIRERAERNMANDQNDSAASSQAESIRQSEDTSATLSVNEERSIDSDNENTTQKSNNTRKTDSEIKKPPVVTTPKPPTSNNSSTPPKANNNAATNPPNAANANAATNSNSDSIKELIQEKSN